MTEVSHYAYISTGKLNAMFTLWTGRSAPGLAFTTDHYVCNLSAAGNEDEAERKAIDFCDRMSERMGVRVNFDGFQEFAHARRRGKLSARQTANIEQIEAGLFPFGKHAGQPIADAPDGYVLFFADKHADTDPVIAALSAACMGVAMERDLIAKRDASRAIQRTQDELSAFVGEVGQRIIVEGEIILSFHKEPTDFADGYTITKVRAGNDIIVYFGNTLGERGQRCRFRATVKRHTERDGIKSTTVNRPAKFEVLGE